MSELMKDPKLQGLMGDMADAFEADGCNAEANMFRSPLSGKQYDVMDKEFERLGAYYKGKKETIKKVRAAEVEPIKANARRDIALRQASKQRSALKEEEQRSAHRDFQLFRQNVALEALKRDYELVSQNPDGRVPRRKQLPR